MSVLSKEESKSIFFGIFTNCPLLALSIFASKFDRYIFDWAIKSQAPVKGVRYFDWSLPLFPERNCEICF